MSDKTYGYGTPTPNMSDIWDLIALPFSVRFDRLLMRTIARFAYLIQAFAMLGAFAGAVLLTVVGFNIGPLTVFGQTLPSATIGLFTMFVIAPVFFVITVVISRVVLEFVVVFFRMNDDIRDIAEGREFTISLESAHRG